MYRNNKRLKNTLVIGPLTSMGAPYMRFKKHNEVYGGQPDKASKHRFESGLRPSKLEGITLDGIVHMLLSLSHTHTHTHTLDQAASAAKVAHHHHQSSSSPSD